MAADTAIPIKHAGNKDKQPPINLAFLRLSQSSKNPLPRLLVDYSYFQTEQNLDEGRWGSSGNKEGIFLSLGDGFSGLMKTKTMEHASTGNCSKRALWDGTIGENLVFGTQDWHRASFAGEDNGASIKIGY